MENLKSRDTRSWFKQTLFQHGALYENIRDEPLVGKQLLGAVDESLELLQWEMRHEVPDEPKPADELLSGQDLEMGGDPLLSLLLSGLSSSRKKAATPKELLAETYVFLLDMKVRMLPFIEDVKQEDVHTIREELRSLLSKDSTLASPEVEKLRPEIAAALAYSYHAFPPASTVEWKEFVQGLTSIQMIAARDDGSFASKPSLPKDLIHLLKSSAMKNSELMDELFVDEGVRTEVMNGVMRDVFDLKFPPDQKWEYSLPYLTTVDTAGDRIGVNVLTGATTSNGVPLQNFDNIYKDSTFINAFGEVQLSSPKIKSDKEPVVYQLQDKAGHDVLVVWNKGSPLRRSGIERIERTINGERFAFISPVDIRGKPGLPALPKHPNEKHYTYWQSLEDGVPTIHIFDKALDFSVCQVSQDGSITDITLPDSDKVYRLLDSEKIPEWEALVDFDGSKYVTAKQSTDPADAGQVYVDFTRYRTPADQMMRFVSQTELVDGIEVTRLHLDHDPQWFVASDQKLKGMPDFKHFLVIENAKGKRKVILPKVNHADSVGSSDLHSMECMQIDITNKGSLRPKTTFENAFVAYHSLMNGQHEKAIGYLKKAHKLQPYDPETLRVMGWMMVSEEELGDGTPNALAVRLYTAWLAKDNLYRNLAEVPDGKPPELVSHYASGEDWKSWWQGHGHWPKEKEENSTFSQRMNALYPRYLSVRKNIQANLRVDASTKGVDKRPSLLSLDEEIHFIHISGAGFSSRERAKHLATRRSVEQLQVKSKKVVSDETFDSGVLLGEWKKFCAVMKTPFAASAFRVAYRRHPCKEDRHG